MGSTTGQTYRLYLEKVIALGAPAPSPSPQGVAFLSCASNGFCAAAPNLNQVAFLSGSAWQAPATIPAAQGITAIDCTGPTFCITIDGEGNSFAYDGSGWSGNLGAWGAANQISCVSPSFCIAAEGGPSVFNGSTWTQPGNTDTQGQLNSVSCATTTFCVMVDSSGDVLTWNGTELLRPGVDRHRAARDRHRRLGHDLGLVPHHDVLPRRRLPRAGLRVERHDLERRHPDRQRPRTHERLVPDRLLLRGRGPVRQRVRLHLITRERGRAGHRGR